MIDILKDIAAIIGLILSIIALAAYIISPLRKFKSTIQSMLDKLDELNNMIFKNEKDRLRSELFNCGNRCRRNIPLYPEEFRFVQTVYQKYKDELHCNSIGTDEYIFIEQYFNSEENQKNIK